MKKLRDFFRLGSGLQMRMTLWVVGSVSVVATLILVIATAMLHQKYEEEVRAKLTSDIDATVKIINQRMIRVEYITKTAASFVEEMIDEPQTHQMETILSDLLRDTKCVDAISLAVSSGSDTLTTMYSAYRKFFSNQGECVAVPPVETSLEEDLSWIKSYRQKEEFWCVPYSPQDFPQVKLQCFSVPVYGADGCCRGMFCTMVLEQWIEEIVKEYKTRPDIDVSIYSREGVLVVGPGYDIAATSAEDKIVEDRMIDRLGWRIILTADRHVITEKLSPLIWQMVAMIVVLLLCMVLAIALTVRYVARPYVLREQHNAEVKAAMERELQIAADTQRQLVPHQFPPFPERAEVSIHACLHPALQVGGDLYDYFLQQDILYFCLGDVSGKGVPASLFMAATHYLFRNAASAPSVTEAVQQINRSLCTDNEQCNFVTFFFGRLDLKTGMLEYCNAGHNAPILIHGGEARFFAESESTPLGVWDEADYPSHTLQLCVDDTVLLYTDGVTEAMNAEGEKLGDDATLRCMAECLSETPEEIIAHLLQCVRRHAGGEPQSDDITMLCIRKK